VKPGSLVALGLTCVLALVAAPQARAAADLSGVWTVAESQWSAEKLPFTPQGRAAFDANHPGKGPRLLHNPRERNDPLVKGNPPGLYRTLVYPRPMQLIQAPGMLVQVFEWSRVWRPIYIDGRPVPKDVPAGPFWYGHSVGHWEGDTLVVDTLGLDSRAWFDEWGTPFTDDTHVQERWRRVAPDVLQLQLTVTDPALYTRPWTSMPVNLRLQKNGTELTEIIHAPIDEADFEQIITSPAGGK
jgi:hypothetical protein